MIQRFRFGSPLPTDSVVQELPVSEGAVPFLTAEADGGWSYAMAPDAVVYGLGEMPRGINKRGWHYVANNTDESHHGEDKRSYYGAHNFLLIDGGGRRTSAFSSISRAKFPTTSATRPTVPCGFLQRRRTTTSMCSPAAARTTSPGSSVSSSGAATSRPSGPSVWRRAAGATRLPRMCGRWPGSTETMTCRWTWL